MSPAVGLRFCLPVPTKSRSHDRGFHRIHIGDSPATGPQSRPSSWRGIAATNTKDTREPGVIRTLIPARIDRLEWSPFHTRLMIALGVAWVLDGLEITVAGAIGPVLQDKATLGLSSTQVGAIATVYLLGEVFGALFFGRLADALGRRRRHRRGVRSHQLGH